MAHPATTIPIAFVHSMLHGARARGLAQDSFLDTAGITPALLEEAGARVTVEQYVRLFKVLVEGLDDDFLGLQSRPLRRGSFTLIARSAVTAPTLEVAIRRIARTYRLLQDDVCIKLVHDGSQVGFTLQFADPDRQWPVFLHELLLRVFWRLLAWFAGGKLPVTRFDFAFERPDNAHIYDRVFPSPLSFGCVHSAFWFDAARLHHRVRQDEASLVRFLSNAQENVILPRRATDSVSANVRSYLQQSYPLWPDMVSTAESLNVSTATLQRHLAAEGTTFQALKDALRRDMAIHRLNTSAVTLPVLASELGFSDSASFQRAFKGWTGSAPGAYRRREAA